MSDGLVEGAASLPPQVVGAIGAIAAFLVVLAIAAQRSARHLRAALDEPEQELVDRSTGLLPASAVRVRLGAELAWALTSRTPIAFAMLRIRGSRFPHAARVLRHGMREEESAFHAGEQRVVVELWDADPVSAGAAVRRLGRELAAAGHPVVDAGIACGPRDGRDVEQLLAAARRDMRPIDDPRPLGAVADGARRAPSPIVHTLHLLASALLPFAALTALLLCTWRLVPAAIEPALAGGGRGAGQIGVLLVTLLGVPAGAALLHAAMWDRPRGAAASRPRDGGGVRAAGAIAALVGLPLAWAIAAPRSPAGAAEAVGATLSMLALVVLVLVHGRGLVHLRAPMLLGLASLGALITWLAVEQAQLPVVANGGRLLLAAALGAALAQLVERASWMATLALLVAAVDVWSVVSRSGVTRRLLESGGGGGDRLLDLLLFTGPAIDGAPRAAIGLTDLVFLALFLSWAHDWRLDMRPVAAAMVAALWLTVVASELADAAVPALPLLSLAMLVTIAVRSRGLRARVAAWGGGRPDGDDASG